MDTQKLPKHPTAPIRPTVDFEGKKIEDDVLFFHFPNGIGDILSGHSDILTSAKPLTKSVRIRDSMVALAVGLIIGLLIHLFAHPSSTLLLVAAYAGPALACVFLMKVINSYSGQNYYVGKQGFAKYWCTDHPDKLIVKDELCFDNITDLYFSSVEVSSNFIYKHTSFSYSFRDRNTGQKVYEIDDTFDKNKAMYETEISYRFGRAIEKRWTEYLLEKMNAELAQHGHISFFLPTTLSRKHRPFIELSRGSITFVKKKGESFTYQALDIQSVSRTLDSLVIKHKNYQRVNLLFRKGNEDHIPISSLGNKAFFLIAFEKLMGFKVR